MQTQQQIWDWYKTFSHNNNLYGDDRPNNCFIKNDLSVVPTELQLKVPAPYGQFLEEIGHGWLREDATGRVTNSRDNAFLSFDEISLIINKQSPEWDIYEDLIEENEIPFFSPNANSFFVFAPDGGVYYPYRVRKFADDLHQFLAKLMNDVTFYAEKG